jgi:hypothetical protein
LTIDGTVIPREASARIRAMSPEERAQWDRDRLRAKTDQLFLSGILGFDLVENPHAALFHQMLPKRPGTPLHELDTRIKRRMILWQRGSCKTSATVVEIVQLILNYPDIRICFLTAADALAKRQLVRIKNLFEKPTPKFLELFPEFCLTSVQSKKGDWRDIQQKLGTMHQFTVPCRSQQTFAEPTFVISTTKSQKTGSHFDVIFCDDLVTDQNYKNDTALEACYQSYLDLVPLLDPEGFIFVSGTRYAFGDCYERIMDNAKAAGEMSVWKFSIQGCWSKGNCVRCGHAEVFHDKDVNVVESPCFAAGCHCQGFESDGIERPLFPQIRTARNRLFGFTRESLEAVKHEIGPANFSNQYLLTPLAAELQTFTEVLIGRQTLHHPAQLPNEMLSYNFLVGDLAYSDTEASDLSVIYTVRKYRGELFVVGCDFGHWRSNELIQALMRLILSVRPTMIWLEKPAGPADALNNLITAQASQLGIAKLPIQWIPVSNQKNAKATRIGNLVQVLDSKRMWLYAPMGGYDELVRQMLRHGRTKHDDFLDALALAAEVPSGWQFDEVSRPDTSVGGWLRKLGVYDKPDDTPPGANDGSSFCM